MIFFDSGAEFKLRATAAASPKALEEVEGFSLPLAEESPGTWVPATGGSLTLCFFGHPASNTVPASSNAMDIVLFIDVSVQVRPCVRVP
jgi:hypothetical protein